MNNKKINITLTPLNILNTKHNSFYIGSFDNTNYYLFKKPNNKNTYIKLQIINPKDSIYNFL